MLNYKNLIILLVSLIIILLGVVLLAPKGSDKAKEDKKASVTENSKDDSDFTFAFEDEKLPEGYVAVLGYQDIYKVVRDGEIQSYQIKLSTDEFADYDINKPDNYIVHNEVEQIYKAVDGSGKVIYYRHFNGKEWDVVNAEGDIVLSIPDNYTRNDKSQELYIDNETKELKKINFFADGSYAWSTIEQKDNGNPEGEKNK